MNTEDVRVIETMLRTHGEARMRQARDMHPEYGRLWSEALALMMSGGKRIRPRMVLLAYRMFGGEDVASIIPIAAAHELLHFGILVHDDIIDRDDVRYGVKNVTGRYEAFYEADMPDDGDRHHYAQGAALLAGDLMISDAYQMMLQADVAPERIVAVQKILGDGIFEVVGGELLDTEAAFRGSGVASPEKIALHKTASYTFVLPMLIGATLAGASEEQKEQLVRFAQNLGVAFQLRDDILGVFGDAKKTGKTTSGDIREGKKTYMVERFYECASEQQKTCFNALFGHEDISDDEVTQVRQLLVDSGARAETEDGIKRYADEARAILDGLTIDAESRHAAETLIIAATDRVI